MIHFRDGAKVAEQTLSIRASELTRKLIPVDVDKTNDAFVHNGAKKHLAPGSTAIDEAAWMSRLFTLLVSAFCVLTPNLLLAKECNCKQAGSTELTVDAVSLRVCSACEPSSGAAAKKAAGAYKGVFYANDFSYLEDPSYDGWLLGDRFKRLAMPNCGNLDLGGQLRFRYHDERGMKGPQRFQNTADEFLLTRLRLFANYEASDILRIYAEGIYADSGHEFWPARGIDENHGDLLNLFADVKMTDAMTVRVGRQELLFGSQRVVSPLDWANTRRTFEGVNILYKAGELAVSGFYTQFVPVRPKTLDEAESALPFYGAYATYTGIENTTVDIYYLGAENDLIGQSLHTIGGRYMETMGDCMVEVEGAVQVGDRTARLPQDGEAFVTLGLGHKFSERCWQPTIWAYYDYATENYNHLYPLAHKYLGFIDAVQRTNIESPNILLTVKPRQDVTLLAWYYHFQSNSDAPVPSVGGTPAQGASRNFGNELDLLAKWQMTPRSDILFAWSHLWRGSKILNPGDADFFYTQLQINF